MPEHHKAEKTTILSEEQLISEYSVKIKDVIIELPDYEYFHSPVANDNKISFNRFIGRRKIRRRLSALLETTTTQSGAYLVTGFRGMGKTSVVRKVIKDLNQKKRREVEEKNWLSRIINNTILKKNLKNRFLKSIRSLYRNLSGLFQFLFFSVAFGALAWIIPTLNSIILQDFRWISPKSWWQDIIGKSIQQQSPQYLFDLNSTPVFRIVAIVLFSWMALSLIIFFLDSLWYTIRFVIKSIYPTPWAEEEAFIKHFEINLSQDEVRVKEVLRQITIQLNHFWLNEIECLGSRFQRRVHLIWFPFLWVFKRNAVKGIPTYLTIKERLEKLNDRLLAEVTLEREHQGEATLGPNIGLFKGNLGIKSRNQISYPIATPKEVESELIQILEDIDFLRKRCNKNSSRKKIKAIEKPPRLIFKFNVPEHIPKLVFITDELDKIEPNASSVIRSRESADPYFDQDYTLNQDPFSTTKIRQRQEAIARLLANLKGFFNVARAKFIFIGGREMYDASLADIADRDSFYSSIFHDVIYVNSFFKDKIEVRSGVTRMTEAYLCSIIIPEDYLNELASKKITNFDKLSQEEQENQKKTLLSLPIYYQYLTDKDYDKGLKLDREFFHDKVKLYKIIALLQKYVIYLTYRSNGSPKKLSNVLESLITPMSRNKLEKNTNFLIVKRKDVPKSNWWSNNNSNDHKDTLLCLRFTFNTQYEIGLTSDLYRPYLINHSRVNKALGDKLLFSSAFIIDHILKFHPFGFSWRNLELIPEIILVNKEPNLRGFIEDIVRFLSRMYIRPTVSGIFQYKFFNRVRNELRLLSKISELGSAAFNFTLDESLQIKRHYKRKLEELEKRYQEGDQDNFNHSIVLLQTILGDLHFYDKEYDDSLLYYAQSLEALRVREAHRKMTKHQFLIWIRNKLKSGLTLEKVRAFDSAYSFYRKLILEIPQYLESIIDAGFTSNNVSFKGVKPYRSLHMIIQPFVACLALVEKQRIDGINLANLRKNESELDKLYRKIVKEYKRNVESKDPNLNNLINTRVFFLRADYFNSVGSILFYKNRYFTNIIEYNLGEDVEKTLFPELKNASKFKAGQDKQDYRSGLTAYVYYKRSLINLIRPHINVLYHDQRNEYEKGVYSHTVFLLEHDQINKVNASKAYYIANVLSKIGDCLLSTLDKSTLKTFDGNTIKHFQNFVNYRKHQEENSQKYHSLIQYWLKVARSLDNGRANCNTLLRINNIIFFYSIAAIYYLKAGRTYSYTFVNKKLIYLIEGIIDFEDHNKNKFKDTSQLQGLLSQTFKLKELIPIIDEIVVQIIKSNTWATDISNRPQIQKYRHIFDLINHSNDDRWAIFNSTTNASEIREVLLLVETLKLKLFRTQDFLNLVSSKEKKRYKTPMIEGSLISPYGNIASQFLRIIELKYRNDIYEDIIRNELNLDCLFEERIDTKKNTERQELIDSINNLIEKLKVGGKDFNPNKYVKIYPAKPPNPSQNMSAKPSKRNSSTSSEEDTTQKPVTPEYFIGFLIREALFCNMIILKTLRLFGTDYIFNFTKLAEAHHRSGRWCVAMENLGHAQGANFRDYNHDKLKQLTGSDDIFYFEPNYHFEQAIQNYYSAIQSHSEGRAYQNRILNLYALEDDYHDNLSHFKAALERLKINSGMIRERLNDLHKIRNQSRLYKLEHYFPDFETRKYDNTDFIE